MAMENSHTYGVDGDDDWFHVHGEFKYPHIAEV